MGRHPHPELDGKKPREASRTLCGARRIEPILNSLLSGLPTCIVDAYRNRRFQESNQSHRCRDEVWTTEFGWQAWYGDEHISKGSGDDDWYNQRRNPYAQCAYGRTSRA